MMTMDMFTSSLAQAAPPSGARLALQALWWARKGEWDRAHGCVQQNEGDPECDLVHAHLHREEGDLVNARSWYQQAGRAMPDTPLADEWVQLAGELVVRS